MSEVTRILEKIEQGDSRAAAQLLPLVYDELRKLAAARLSHEKPGQTLQATALVHEAYLRLIGDSPNDAATGKGGSWNSRGHFFGAAAEAMRRILVEQARRKQATKRGGDQQRIELRDIPAGDHGQTLDLIALDEALTELATVDAQAAELVKLRYFAGLSGAEAAQTLGISPRSADRIWLYARTWLRNKLDSE
jgi:RNA polymerase sigma factor (TIGR02999 family)